MKSSIFSRINRALYAVLLIIPSVTMAHNDSYMVILGSGEPDAATRCTQMVKIFASAGRKVELFLMNEAVDFSVLENTKNIKSSRGDFLHEYMNYVIEKKIPVCACKPCLKARGIDKADMFPGAEICTGKDLAEKTGTHTEILTCL